MSKEETYSDNLHRPDEDIAFLYQLLFPASQEVMSDDGCFLENADHIFLIESGHFDIIRSSDGLLIGSGKGPIVVGLMLFFDTEILSYIQMLEPGKVRAISIEEARRLIDQHGAWKVVANILAYFLRRSLVREQKMIAQTTYQVVCYRLNMYMKNRDVYIKNNVGIAKFILRSTFLSRSQVYNILSNLSKGGYIEMDNGKLMSINYLPKGF